MATIFFKTCSTGGTFNSFHKGHKEYLEIAFSLAQKVHIYLSTDEHARAQKPYLPKPYGERLLQMVSFLKDRRLLHRAEIIPLPNNKILEEQILKHPYDVVLVEPAYFDQFSSINTKRVKKNKKAFSILLKPRTLDYRKKDISSTRMEYRLYKQIKDTKYSSA